MPSMASSSAPSSQTPKGSTTNTSSTPSLQMPVQTTTSSSSTVPTPQMPHQTTAPSPYYKVPSTAHGPSNLPPVPYSISKSPWELKQPRQHSKDIEPTKLSALMNRMDRIEDAVGKYVDERGKGALKKSVVPGLDTTEEDSANKA